MAGRFWLFVVAFLALAVAPACTRPPQATGGLASGAAASGRRDLTIDFRLAGAARKVLFNGGSGASRNDIASLVVGLFDNGTTTAPSLGYFFLGAAGTSPAAQALANASPTQYVIGAGAQSLYAFLGTAGTSGGSSSGYTIVGDKTNLRRYLLRDFGDGSSFTSGATSVNFSNIPAAGAGHQYLVFAAAYDSALNNLGYAEAAVADALTQATSTQSVQLTLNLSRDVWTSGLTASGSLTSFRPSPSGSLLVPGLAAVHQSLGVTGATVVIEGKHFGSSVDVTFPGGAMVAATVLGQSRATVSVPAGATEGDLTISTRGITAGPVPFRRVTYTPGLQPFHSTANATFDQAGTARMASKLSVARSGHTAHVIGNYVYVIGGEAGGALQSVERAAIHPDGTLSPFTVVPGVTLQTGRARHTSAVIGDYLYVVGGVNSTPRATVERAAIGADGSLSTFSTVAGADLVAARYDHEMAVVGRFLYVIGGYDTGYLAAVERAAIYEDGTISPFQTVSGVDLTAGRSAASSFVTSSYLYVAGGYVSGSGISAAIERAAISGDGTISDFAPVAGVTLSSPRADLSSVSFGGAFYLLGGIDSVPNATVAVEKAVINADGTLPSFSPVSGGSLRTARFYHASVVAGNYVYVIGGWNGSANLASVERASIDASGGLASFGAAENNLSVARDGAMTAAIGKYVYVLGGEAAAGTALADVERAAVGADGSLGTFSTAGVSMVGGRRFGSCAVVGDRLYVLGGRDLAGTYTGSVEYAPIDASGGLGAFVSTGLNLSVPRAHHTALVIGGYLYVIGGSNGADQNSVERAAINADSSLGTFGGVSASLLTARNSHAAVVIGNTLYVVGGFASGAGVTSIEGATINADGSLQAFSPFSGLTTGRGGLGLAVVGSYLYALGGSTGGVAREASIERAFINSTGTLGTWAPASAVLGTPRMRLGSVVAGNRLLAIGGNGSSGVLASVEAAALE